MATLWRNSIEDKNFKIETIENLDGELFKKLTDEDYYFKNEFSIKNQITLIKGL